MIDPGLLRNVANSMQLLADSIRALAEDPAVKEDESVKTPLKLETVRARLGEISRAGYTDQIHGLIQKHGATHLSKVAPEEYETLLEEAEALTNAS